MLLAVDGTQLQVAPLTTAENTSPLWKKPDLIVSSWLGCGPKGQTQPLATLERKKRNGNNARNSMHTIKINAEELPCLQVMTFDLCLRPCEDPATTMSTSVIAAPPDRLNFDKGALEEEGKEQYLRTLG